MTYAGLTPYEILTSECAAQESASDNDIKAALAFEMPTTKSGKCLEACIGEKTGVVSHRDFSFISVICIFMVRMFVGEKIDDEQQIRR